MPARAPGSDQGQTRDDTIVKDGTNLPIRRPLAGSSELSQAQLMPAAGSGLRFLDTRQQTPRATAKTVCMITWKPLVFQETCAASQTGVRRRIPRNAGQGRKMASATSAAATNGTLATMARIAADSSDPAGCGACAQPRC